MEYSNPPPYCPDCRAPLTPAPGPGTGQGTGEDGPPPPRCPYCALPLTGEAYEKVRRIDAELAGLDRRRAELLGRRQVLLNGLRAEAGGVPRGGYQGAAPAGAASQAGAPQGGFGPAPVPGGGPGSGGPPRAGRPPWAGRPETSSYTARNVLLVLGGVLLTVAAFAFTLLSWGDLGVGGRAAVLGALTLGTLAVPVPLLRRGLSATAESVAGFGLALLTLDAYALGDLTDVDGPGYAAASAAVIAALWTGYGLTLPGRGLRLVLPFAVAVAQLPLPLWALSLEGPAERRAYAFAAALLVAFAADVALAGSRDLHGRGDRSDLDDRRDLDDRSDRVGRALGRATARPVRLTAAAAAVPAGVLMTAVTLWHGSWRSPGEIASAARWYALLAVAAAVLLYGGHRARRRAGPAATVAGLLLTASLGGVAWAVLSGSGAAGWDWRVLVHLLCAAALPGTVLALRASASRTRGALPPPGQSAGLVAAAAVVQCGALAWTLLPLTEAVAGPWYFATRAWEGAPDGPVWQAVDTSFAYSGSPAVPLVLLLLALSAPLQAAALATAGRGEAGRTEAGVAEAERAEAGGGGEVPAREVPAGETAGGDGGRGAEVPAGAGELRRLLLSRPYAAALHALPVPVALCAAAGATAVLRLPYLPALGAVTLLAVAFMAAAAVAAATPAGVAALVSGLALAATATGWALAEQGSTLGVLALICAACTAGAARARAAGPGRRSAFAASAVVYAAALAWALAAALGHPAHLASFAVLAVAAGTVPAAALLRRRATAGGSDANSPADTATSDTPPSAAATAASSAAAPAATTPAATRRAVSLAVECAGYAAATVALLLCVARPETLWPALAVCAVSAAGVAVRSDRRPGAAYASAALLVLATWVRLSASEVATPEAYTLPVTAALLITGGLRRRRAAQAAAGQAAPGRVSSWWAYGGGLGFTFLPSLIALGDDPHWLRPLLLGGGALATTLAGARWRAQAPLLLGGATLAAVGLHELAPYLVQVALLLPRWLVPAFAGLLLVVAGATYERRLEEARRVKRAWQRLS